MRWLQWVWLVGGNRTVSMTWTVPLLAAMSAPVTLVSFTVIASASDTANLMVAPLRVSMGPETLSELGSVNNSQYQYIGEVS